ncbi:MAG: hypothetical protein DHS20C11_09310 [Lysobacteraceae bacterium]|nr:MAG: hypothetical protein DHS20C11_09310 [Xanthomonadaceae bacterium]
MNNVLSAMIIRVLRPLVRILLKQDVSFRQFAELARWVYVDVAQEFGIDGKPPTKSRISVITGLSRVEVARLQESSPEQDTIVNQHWHRAGRVLSAWANEPEYQDRYGQPRVIPIEGDTLSFEHLVAQHSGGTTVKSVLDEVLRVAAVERLDDGQLRLLRPFYLTETSSGDEQNLHVLGLSTESLINTIGHNIEPDQDEPFFQRLVLDDGFDPSVLPTLRAQLRRRGQTLANEVDGFLAGIKTVAAEKADNVRGSARVGMGIYYFESPVDQPDQPE